jgi:hypothetical protein
MLEKKPNSINNWEYLKQMSFDEISPPKKQYHCGIGS